MPTTKEALQRLLDFFAYAMLRAVESLGNAPLSLRTVEEEGLRKFLLINFPKFQASENPKVACEAYTKSIDEGGLFATTDTTFSGDEDTVHAEIGDLYPYRRVSTMRHDERHPVPCIRAFALAEMLRLRLDADFDWKLDRFGRPCRITLSRTRWG